MKNKTLFFLIIILFLNPSVRLYCFALNDIDSSSNLVLQEGTQSIQIYLVNEIGLAYKYHLSSSSALRLRLDVSAHLSNNSDEYKYVLKENDSTTQIVGVKIRDNSGTMQVTLDYIFYLNPKDNFTAYFGVGPFISYGRGFVERTSDNKYVNYTQTNYDYKVGLVGDAGLEVLIFKNLRIIGQYDLSVSYGESEIKDDGNTQNTYRTERRINRLVQLSSVKLGIVFYF